MEARDIARIVDSMLDDDLDVLAQLLELSLPETTDQMLMRENGRPFCPTCGCAMSRNGTDGRGHQKWICRGCGKTLSSTTSHPPERTRLNARKWVVFVKCELSGVPLRHACAYCRISLKTAFMLRQKLQWAISGQASSSSLSGRVEMDAKFFRINLKGTRPHNMPRVSKRRGSGSTDPGHRVCAIFAIDENDAMAARIVGLGPESREKADRMIRAK